MTQPPKLLPLADSSRFKTIQDLTRLRPDCGASIEDILVIDNECLLIIDLANVGSLLNPYNSLSASYVRMHGVMVESYIHPETIPVLWQDPILLLPLSHHLEESDNAYKNVADIVGSISCPWGTILFLPFGKDVPAALLKRLDDALATETGVKINLPNGNYRVFYEQFEAPEGYKPELFQNIVVNRQ